MLVIKRIFAILFLGFVIISVPSMQNRFIIGPDIITWFTGYTFMDNEGVVFQKGKSDCGPAALLYVFKHYGIKSTIEQIEAVAGTNEIGTSMLGLKKMAELKGLNAVGWKYTWGDFKSKQLPVIAFVNGNHYVVVDSIIENRELIIIDPTRGRLKMNKQKFKKIWQGETLQIEKADLKGLPSYLNVTGRSCA